MPDSTEPPAKKTTVFVSYTGADKAWAQWIAWTLEATGEYDCTIQAWDFGAGSNFVLDMHKATMCDRTVAVLSEKYLQSAYTAPEWAAAFANDPKGENRKLVPVRIAPFTPDGLFNAHVYIDLVGLPEEKAKETLLSQFKIGRAKPETKPAFPGVATATALSPPAPAPFPENPTSHWQIPAAVSTFTGRVKVLEDIQAKLTAHKRAALVGTPGLGKTQTALRYAEVNRSAYRHGFWISAENEFSLKTGYIGLATLLDIRWKDTTDIENAVRFALNWLSERDDWLLILDNADNVHVLQDDLLPKKTGHLLITTRDRAIRPKAPLTEIHRMEPAEGADCLLACAGIDEPTDEECTAAASISRLMDGLPLALAQAGAYINNTGCGVEGYLSLYKNNKAELLKRNDEEVTEDERTAYRVFTLAVAKASEKYPVVEEVLRLCAFLDSNDIPEVLFTHKPDVFSESLAEVASKDLDWNETLAAVRRVGLIERHADANTFSVHNLLQEVLRSTILEVDQRLYVQQVMEALVAVAPESEPENWSFLDILQPHQLTCVVYLEVLNIESALAAQLLSEIGCHAYQRGYYFTLTEDHDVIYFLLRAVAICEKVKGEEHPDTAKYLNNLGALYHYQDKYKDAEHYLLRALMIYEKIFGVLNSKNAMCINNIAELYHSQGRYKESELYHLRALQINESTFGVEHPHTAMSLANIGSLYKSQGRDKEAEMYYLRALVIHEKILGAEHPHTATSLDNLGSLYKSQGRDKEAEMYHLRALVIYEKVLGTEHPDTAISLGNLAEVYRSQGRYKEAETGFLRALMINEKILGEYHHGTAHILGRLASLCHNQGKYKDSEAYFLRALYIKEKVIGAKHPEIAYELNNLAWLYYHQGKYKEARTLFERAYNIRKKRLGANHPLTIQTYENWIISRS